MHRYTHSENAIKLGLGVLLKNYWNTEFEYFYSQENFLLEEDVSDHKETIAGISLSAQLDLLDDVLLPKNGILLKGKYENSSVDWGAANNYHLYQG